MGPIGVKKLAKGKTIRKQCAAPSVRRPQKVMLGIKHSILWKTVNMSRELEVPVALSASNTPHLELASTWPGARHPLRPSLQLVCGPC